MGANEKKAVQLGMPLGTASAQLRKMILFALVQETGKDACFRCGRKIETIEEFSIEHKESWLDRTVELFWDLKNIAFSHLSCNVKHARRPNQKFFTPEEQLANHRQLDAARHRKAYTPEKRLEKYLTKGY